MCAYGRTMRRMYYNYPSAGPRNNIISVYYYKLLFSIYKNIVNVSIAIIKRSLGMLVSPTHERAYHHRIFNNNNIIIGNHWRTTQYNRRRPPPHLSRQTQFPSKPLHDLLIFKPRNNVYYYYTRRRVCVIAEHSPVSRYYVREKSIRTSSGGAVQLPSRVVCVRLYRKKREILYYIPIAYYYNIVKHTAARCLQSKKRLRKRIITCPVGGRMRSVGEAAHMRLGEHDF